MCSKEDEYVLFVTTLFFCIENAIAQWHDDLSQSPLILHIPKYAPDISETNNYVMETKLHKLTNVIYNNIDI